MLFAKNRVFQLIEGITFRQEYFSQEYRADKSLCTCFGEVQLCYCLPLLPELAYNILATAYEDFLSALYVYSYQRSRR